MTLYTLDPIEDPRWQRFVLRHPRSSVFHMRGWLESLRCAYGYTPIVYTLTPPGQELENGIAFCYVKSFLTGRRLVSLPFSDHCDPLVDKEEDMDRLLRLIPSNGRARDGHYIELRPLEAISSKLSMGRDFHLCSRFYNHEIDLRKGPDVVFESLHKDCVQRKIRRARKEALGYREGSSEVFLKEFYALHCRTRRRHGLVPQPRQWFRHLTEHLGDSFKISVAYKNEEPIAAIVTLTGRDSVFYKYGCSNPKYHALGGMQLLLWKTIEEACDRGLIRFDLGRSELHQTGLIVFKERWGAPRRELVYLRHPSHSALTENRMVRRVLDRLLPMFPISVLEAAGTLLYRHVA